eukprot:g2298.t1
MVAQKTAQEMLKISPAVTKTFTNFCTKLIPNFVPRVKQVLSKFDSSLSLLEFLSKKYGKNAAAAPLLVDLAEVVFSSALHELYECVDGNVDGTNVASQFKGRELELVEQLEEKYKKKGKVKVTELLIVVRKAAIQTRERRKSKVQIAKTLLEAKAKPVRTVKPRILSLSKLKKQGDSFRSCSSVVTGLSAPLSASRDEKEEETQNGCKTTDSSKSNEIKDTVKTKKKVKGRKRKVCETEEPAKTTVDKKKPKRSKYKSVGKVKLPRAEVSIKGTDSSGFLHKSLSYELPSGATVDVSCLVKMPKEPLTERGKKIQALYKKQQLQLKKKQMDALESAEKVSTPKTK